MGWLFPWSVDVLPTQPCATTSQVYEMVMDSSGPFAAAGDEGDAAGPAPVTVALVDLSGSGGDDWLELVRWQLVWLAV
jgi:hypothetical protein